MFPILHITPTYIPAYRYGGPIYSVHGLCKALAHLGYEVHVYTTNVDGDKDSEVPIGQPVDLEGVKVWYFPSQFIRRLYYSPQLEKHLKNTIQQFAIVHLHSVFLWPTLVGARYAKKHNIPYILTPRGMLVKDLIARKSAFIKKAWIALFEQYNILHAKSIHLTSEAELLDLKKFNFKLPHTFVIPNGIDIPSSVAEKPLSDPLGKPDKLEYMLLFLSRINWKKGLDQLIPAMQNIDNTYLRIIGNDEENYLPELKQLAIKFKVDHKIFFHSAIHGEVKQKLYQAASIFILPSYSENFGNVILEALSYGCPVIITPEVGLAPFVKKHNLGLVVERSPEKLTEAILLMLNNTEKRHDIQKNAPKIIIENFSWYSVAKSMQQEYQNIIQAK